MPSKAGSPHKRRRAPAGGGPYESRSSRKRAAVQADERVRLPAQLSPGLAQRAGERTAELGEAVENLKQSEAMIQTLFRISKKLNATLNLDTILDDLAQEAIQIVNGESGFAGLRTADGMTVRKYFRQGKAIPFDYTWPAGQDIPGWVLK